MAASSEDAIVRNRLLNDTRLFRKCAVRFYDSKSDAAHFLTELSQVQVGLRKHQLIHDMTERQVQLYEEEKGRILADIEKNTRELATLREHLAAVKIVRQNKLEYDALAEKITAYNTRPKSVENAVRLRAKIAETRLRTSTVRRKQELRKKQLLTIITAIQELQDSIAEDNEDESTEGGDVTYIENNKSPPAEEEEEGVVDEEKDVMDTT
ncbi:THO complex subunit 7 [Geranomyces variabilis]|uniref:THO complex subunit 7 n=1 Tax=Geranomyces variabilis TaxID=109894 RepID=A0AAD5TJ22_9FUNG|nr:THO complex subunit 7 [Geranomyces variabilis]